jgi:3-dehydroquinate synthetase
LLGRFKLPTLPALEPRELLRFTARDKKATEKGLVWVLPTSRPGEPFGHFQMTADVQTQEILEILEDFLADPFRR